MYTFCDFYSQIYRFIKKKAVILNRFLRNALVFVNYGYINLYNIVENVINTECCDAKTIFLLKYN